MSEGSAKRYRVGVIGFAHMHVNELVARFIACGRADIVACADTAPRTPSLTEVEGSRRANLRRALQSPGGPRAYDDYQDMLRKEHLDIAIFCPENARHGEVAEAIAGHGVHMVTEKPMAARLDEALRMKAAAEKAGVALAVNWPITWHPAYRKLKQLLSDGAIGDVWELKWRNGNSLGPLAHGSSHPGATVVSGLVSPAEKGSEWWHQAETGGGALLDYCCYGACLAAWLLPEPAVAVQCLKANLMSGFGDAEDNAAMLVRFPAALAVLEASWTTFHIGVPNGPIVYGTHGTIVLDGADILDLSRTRREAAHLRREGGLVARGTLDDRRGIHPSPRDRRSLAPDSRLSNQSGGHGDSRRRNPIGGRPGPRRRSLEQTN